MFGFTKFKAKVISILMKNRYFAVFFEFYQESKKVIDIRKRSVKSKINLINSFIFDNINNIEIGKNVAIGAFNVFCVIDQFPEQNNKSKLLIGDGTYIGEQNNIRAAGGSIYIGSNCLISQQVSIVTTNHGVAKDELIKSQAWVSKGDIIIEDDVWIGCSAQILSGVKIGKGAVISAGSLVNKDVLPYSVMAGIPAKQIKYRT